MKYEHYSLLGRNLSLSCWLTCLLLVVTPPGSAQSSTTPGATSAGATDIDTTTNSELGNTSSGATRGQASSATGCSLAVSADQKEDVMDKVKEIFMKDAVYISFKLEIDGLTDIYDNSSDVVDPLTWVWALEGKGELFLSYPFDFELLSLKTLSPGVFTVEVPVSLPADECFQEAADANKQRIIAKFINGLVQSVNSTLNLTDKETYADKASKICLEKQLGPDEFNLVGVYAIPVCTYYVLQGSTVHECWPATQDPFNSETNKISKHGWLGTIFAVGFILAFFSPLAGSFFVRQRPPIKRDDGLYLAINSDLPLGLKYLLCFSFQDYPAIVAIRWFVYVVAFMIIPLIPFVASYLTTGDSFLHRMDVVYDLLLSKSLVIFWFILVNLFFLTIAMLFLGLYLYDGAFVPNSLTVKTEDCNHFGFAFDLPNKLCIPVETDNPLRGFFLTMLRRTQMAINPAVWGFWFLPIWDFAFGLLGKRSDGDCRNWCRVFVTAIIFAIVFPFALFIFCFFLLLNSVPLIYMVTWTVAKCLSKPLNAAEVFVAFMAMFLSFAILFIFVAAFAYIAELLGYTFIGFVINSDFVGPFIVAFVTAAGYLIGAATTFYDKYCLLLKRLITTAENVDKEMAKKREQEVEKRREHRASRAASEAGREEIELQPMAEDQAMLPEPRKLVKTENGVPMIPLSLFNIVVAKYQPMYLEVAGILLQLIIIAIVVAFGLATIIFIDSVSDLPATVEFFATVVVAGVVPVLMLILKSPAKEENEGEAKQRQLETYLEHYATCELGQESSENVA